MEGFIEGLAALITFLLVVVCVVLMLIGLISLFKPLPYIESRIRNQLAHQIAAGTHEVVWSTNEFGTLEVRIEEVKGTK